MRKRTLQFICCPECGGELELIPDQTAGDFVEKGYLRCGACQRVYPIEQGIARLLPIEEIGEWAGKTKEAFSWEWLQHPGSLPEDERIFLEETQLDYHAWKGKLVLDAGCGLGRYAQVALSLGAEVVAMDYSESVRRLVAMSKENHKLHVIQGNLLKPPLRPNTFDIIYSQGVLHHTAAPHDAFVNLARSVKQDGRFTVWLYGKPGKWDEFRTNPLKKNRQWLEHVRYFSWLALWVRHAISEALRAITVRLPVEATHFLCYPVTMLGAVPVLKYFTFSVHPDFQARFFENFDWLSPPYQSHHTKEEVSAWFREAGLTVEKILPHGFVPKVGVLGRKI